MKVVISIGIFLVLAVLTNPTREQHITEVKWTIVSNLLSKAGGHYSSSPKNDTAAAIILGLPLGTAAIREMVDKFVSVDDYLILSLTRVTYKKDSRVIGIGAFGTVWISSDEGRMPKDPDQ